MGILITIASIGACFGAPLLVWHPTNYAELLADKLKKQKVNVWLINNGWSVGSHGVVTQVPHVPADILIPELTWADKKAFAATAQKLAGLFVENFKKFESDVTPEVKATGPKG